ncbi:MAG: class I SAM-dependent methyltransferase [Chloroflexi bacterium]|nr:class I SAM-dependent methyltransferase [Chloroflexota bacterium]MCL5074124.1 class I SAM-dependent methyltransferase [Chloroflexota bacterium]
MSPASLYDTFADRYDLMVSWETRLKNEAPFFQKIFGQHQTRSILDAACGTGQHAIRFAQWGYEVVGTDLSVEMLQRAALNTEALNVSVTFVQAGFGEIWKTLKRHFGAIVCLGNSLPHLLSERELFQALTDFFALLEEGGVVVIQNRNYDRVYLEKQKFMSLDTTKMAGRELLFFRLVDFEGEYLNFHIVTFIKEKGQWRYEVNSTRQRPIFKADLEGLLAASGFKEIQFYSDFQFSPWQLEQTYDLIAVAYK